MTTAEAMRAMRRYIASMPTVAEVNARMKGLATGRPFCERCEGDGSYREMAPCTTFGPGCGCNEWVTVDPCPDCGGTGQSAPSVICERRPGGYWQATVKIPSPDGSPAREQSKGPFDNEREARDWGERMVALMLSPVEP